MPGSVGQGHPFYKSPLSPERVWASNRLDTRLFPKLGLTIPAVNNGEVTRNQVSGERFPFLPVITGTNLEMGQWLLNSILFV